MEELKTIIEDQRKGHENEPMWMVGQQLLDMAAHEPEAVEILKQDLSVSGMGLADAAGALKAYADKHHGKAKVFCITPIIAEEILRDFYKLPKKDEAQMEAPTPVVSAQPEKSAFDALDLSAFL